MTFIVKSWVILLHFLLLYFTGLCFNMDNNSSSMENSRLKISQESFHKFPYYQELNALVTGLQAIFEPVYILVCRSCS